MGGLFSMLRILALAAIGADAMSGFPVLGQIDPAWLKAHAPPAVAASAALGILAILAGVVVGLWLNGGFRARATLAGLGVALYLVGRDGGPLLAGRMADVAGPGLVGLICILSMVWGGPFSHRMRG